MKNKVRIGNSSIDTWENHGMVVRDTENNNKKKIKCK